MCAYVGVLMYANRLIESISLLTPQFHDIHCVTSSVNSYKWRHPPKVELSPYCSRALEFPGWPKGKAERATAVVPEESLKIVEAGVAALPVPEKEGCNVVQTIAERVGSNSDDAHFQARIQNGTLNDDIRILCAHMNAIEKLAQQHRKRGRLERLLGSKLDAEDVNKYKDSLTSALRDFSSKLDLNMQNKLDEILLRLTLDASSNDSAQTPGGSTSYSGSAYIKGNVEYVGQVSGQYGNNNVQTGMFNEGEESSDGEFSAEAGTQQEEDMVSPEEAEPDAPPLVEPLKISQGYSISCQGAPYIQGNVVHVGQILGQAGNCKSSSPMLVGPWIN
ncbi:hypothetical protein NP233_g1877 [Leucocoprinus birnbaumii]|uniref:Uncharacterized protein n=1 Tax=Leucocoprinus birnbaumii TaxID=56174 RepID=A0AAD5W372_9AGAR|nr:hypothetical protein NP233_g1877 [Leucocoprinus birnbaumii]